MIVFLVHLVKHLSRETRKLTVMMRRELVNHSVTYQNLLRFLPYYTKERFPVTYVTQPHSDNCVHTRGYTIDPP